MFTNKNNFDIIKLWWESQSQVARDFCFDIFLPLIKNAERAVMALFVYLKGYIFEKFVYNILDSLKGLWKERYDYEKDLYW